MSSERRLRILDRLVRGGQPPLETTRLCQVCAEMTATTGAGIMLVAEGLSRGSVCTTNSVSELIEELQFTLGEGPCIDASREGQPVLEPDLASPTNDRWIAFGPPAVAAGDYNTYRVVGLPAYLVAPSQFTVIPDGPIAVCAMHFDGTMLTSPPLSGIHQAHQPGPVR